MSQVNKKIAIRTSSLKTTLQLLESESRKHFGNAPINRHHLGRHHISGSPTISKQQPQEVELPRIRQHDPHAATGNVDGQTFRLDRSGSARRDAQRPIVAFTGNQETSSASLDETPSERQPSVIPENDTSDLKTARGFQSTHRSFMDQSRELVDHLQEKERNLMEQEANHHVRVWNWERGAQQQQKGLDSREAKLQHREVQLRALQFELLELQNELIDSKLATRAIVAQLEMPVEAGEKVEALERLKGELFERYDLLSTTWKRLYDQMNGLAQDLAEQVRKVA